MALGLAGKLRLGQATKEGTPKFSKKDCGVVYENPEKVQSPMPAKRPIAGLTKRSGK
jgi:hypothetical protein